MQLAEARNKDMEEQELSGGAQRTRLVVLQAALHYLSLACGVLILSLSDENHPYVNPSLQSYHKGIMRTNVLIGT